MRKLLKLKWYEKYVEKIWNVKQGLIFVCLKIATIRLHILSVYNNGGGGNSIRYRQSKIKRLPSIQFLNVQLLSQRKDGISSVWAIWFRHSPTIDQDHITLSGILFNEKRRIKNINLITTTQSKQWKTSDDDRKHNIYHTIQNHSFFSCYYNFISMNSFGYYYCWAMRVTRFWLCARTRMSLYAFSSFSCFVILVVMCFIVAFFFWIFATRCDGTDLIRYAIIMQYFIYRMEAIDRWDFFVSSFVWIPVQLYKRPFKFMAFTSGYVGFLPITHPLAAISIFICIHAVPEIYGNNF